jgi:prepilin-type N-terminal cleavage/methylation domain-containing protein
MRRLDQHGFSLVEMMSVLIVTAIFVGLILVFTFNYWRYGSLLEADMDTFVTRLNAGDRLREMISSSSGLIIQNSIPDTNRHVPDPADSTGQYWIPLHAIPGNKPVGASGTFTPLIYFRRFSFDGSKAFIMNGTQPYEDEYILYMNGSTKQLLLRSLANESAPGNTLKTTCPPAIATTACPADQVIASDIDSIDMRYFSRTGNLIDYTSAFDPDINQYIGPDYPAVEVVEFKLNLAKKPFLQTSIATRNSTIIRIALRNS